MDPASGMDFSSKIWFGFGKSVWPWACGLASGVLVESISNAGMR